MNGDKTMTKAKGYLHMQAAGSLQHMAKKQTQGRPPEKPKDISVRRLLGEKHPSNQRHYLFFSPTALAMKYGRKEGYVVAKDRRWPLEQLREGSRAPKNLVFVCLD
ncbi:hypothetical protein L3X38_002897 [Prunus dulcis]|uniref:Uncharacterized protein n=1 Tax=Prunus dulcis TaxID=3755 RepID=A0AAD4WVE7_PRUDU|nr:hypothetical protein L3X38_002897 [Prunus dulcis]